MKKKFISGLLLLAVTAGGFSTLTSCKDTDEDLRTELMGQQASLEAALKALSDKLNECQTNCGKEIADIKEQLGKKQDAEGVNKLIAAWAEANQIDQLKSDVAGILKKIEDGELGNGGAGCTCGFSEEELTALKAIAGQAQALIGEGLNGEGGVIKAVEDLNKWFDGIGIDAATFQEYVKQGAWVKAHAEALQGIEDLKTKGLLSEEALQALADNYTQLSKISEMYTILFPEGTADKQWWSYETVMENIQTNSAAIEALKTDVDKLFGRLNDMVTSLVLQATTNNVYPSFNTPFGINSMVLMAYYGELATSAESFPVSNAKDMGAEMYADYNVDWSSVLASAPYEFKSRTLVPMVSDTEASLGNLWFTVNPGTVNNLDVNGFDIVNSVDDTHVRLVNVTKDDDTVLKFGIGGSRAAGNGNGLYVGEAAVAVEDLDNIKINIEDGLVNAVKDAVKNHKAADMMHLLQILYNQVQDLCDANALRYTYNTVTGKDENGNYTTELSKVYTNYGLAATAFKPLSFATLKGTSIRHLPNLGQIEISKDLVNLNLKPFVIGNVELNVTIELGTIEIDPVGDVWVEYKYPSEFDANGNIANWGTDKINIGKDLNDVVANIQASIDAWIKGNGDQKGLDEKIKDAIASAVDTAFNGPDGMIAKIENQVNDMMGSIQDKLDSLVNQINNDYLSKVNSLINKYNSVADRINGMLDDPNHYLQAVMFYKKANGGLGFLSTNAKQPSQFKGNGEAIELFATTYNFEVVCPVFLKVVGVTKVTDQNGNENVALKNAANKVMAEVVNGGRNRFALDVKGAQNGVYTYEIAYQALDYTGHTSTVKTYLQVVRK
ncbi:MAG: hypothetical protein K2G41_05970 [Duncaniella sp.]|uniref:hypothetical protein n=1 Tax=Duncaniella sp. TaxID=2518496 RepID=UPI0023D34C7A|nr:hypothetical protein [Duncaniella sp.]MDE6090231.1 hypothetical protein [Duncaniella sp.]